MKSDINIKKFLSEELGLEEASIELGIKLSEKNNISLPIALWSNGLINLQELDLFYVFLFEAN